MDQKTAARLVCQLGVWEARVLGLPKSKRSNEEARGWMQSKVKDKSFRDHMERVIHPDAIAAATL